jgi:parvulin-like peptidyl-prolyl isomerase
MNMRTIFSAMLVTATAVSTMAATPKPTVSTNAPAATSTNAKPADVMAQLFGDPVIAKGKGVEIKRSQLDEVVGGLKASAAARGQNIPPEQLKLVQGRFLDRLVQIQLLLQKSNDADKAEGKKKTDAQVAELIKRAGSEEKFNQQLKAVGMSADQLRSKMTDEITAMVTLQRECGAKATEAEVNQFYTNHPSDFEQPEKVHVHHILFLTIDPMTREPMAADKKTAKHKQAEDVLKRARKGEDFAKLAEQYSEDPGSKQDGGDLPPFDKQGSFGSGGQMVPEFTAAAFSLTNNQVSDIVTTEFGYHIIKSYGKTPAAKLKLSDKLPSSDVTVNDRLQEVLALQKLETLAPPFLDKLEKDSGVEILDADLKAAVAAAKASATNPPSAMPGAEK